ncbi:MAG: radical SAM protein [Candidatus Omnitrophica bacterium]|nr:radical SAM protein [Candidatus Omnitrophota bacterium]MBU1925758.1 radical SAM protein [Candidatus Omnitrophota bacterium]
MNTRILILYLPSPNQKMLPTPCLGIAVLKGYLKRAGRDVRIDDIEMKYWEKDITTIPLLRSIVRKLPLWFNNPKKIFLNTRQVNRYLDFNIPHERMKKVMSEWEKLLIEPAASFTHIGVSVMTTEQLAASLCFAKYLKEKYGVCIILGGSFMTQRMSLLLECYSFIDYIIVREGEVALDKLLGGEPLENIENLLYRKGGEVKVNPLAAAYADNMEPDFSDLPFSLYGQKDVIMVPYEASKGCKLNCSYCVPGKKPLYIKNPKTVVDEIERIKERYNVSYFSFSDNAINISRDFSIRLCEEFIKRKLDIYWTAYFIIEDEPMSYFRLLKKAGCIQLRCGIETLNEKLGHAMNRRIDPDVVSNALRKSSAVGIWNHLFFIMSYPGDTWRDVLKVLFFIISHKNFFKSATMSCFNISGIDQLMENHKYASYQGTLICRKVWKEKRCGLVYRKYYDIFFYLKSILFKWMLWACGIYFNNIFSAVKDPFNRRLYFYSAFYQWRTGDKHAAEDRM